MAEERRGFAGFDSLVTDLSDLPSPPPTPEARPAARPAATPDGDKGPQSGPPPKPKNKLPPMWIVIAAIVGGLVVIGFVNSERNGSSYSPTSSPTSNTLPATTTPRATVASPSVSQRTPAELEEKPPIGEGTVLSNAQLRYCLAQRIRIDGADRVMNAASQTDINRFNALVDDYNSRCPKARYRTNTMSTVKPEVEARRAQIEAEGAALIRSPIRLK